MEEPGGDGEAGGAGRVTPRRRVVARLATEIRAGDRGPGDRLPSVRALSGRLGFHRNTVRAAYEELERAGLVTVRPGSGVFVRETAADSDPRGSADEPAFRRFLARERASGRPWRETAGLLARWRAAVGAGRVCVVGRSSRLLEIWAAELADALSGSGRGSGVAVERVALDVVRRRPDSLGRCVVAAPTTGAAEVATLVPPWMEVFPLRAGPSGAARRLLLRLPEGAVVTLATRSATVRREMTELAAALRDGAVAVVPLDVDTLGTAGGRSPPGRPEERGQRLLRVARFVLADVPCEPRLAGRVPSERIRTLRHLVRADVAALVARVRDR